MNSIERLMFSRNYCVNRIYQLEATLKKIENLLKVLYLHAIKLKRKRFSIKVDKFRWLYFCFVLFGNEWVLKRKKVYCLILFIYIMFYFS